MSFTRGGTSRKGSGGKSSVGGSTTSRRDGADFRADSTVICRIKISAHSHLGCDVQWRGKGHDRKPIFGTRRRAIGSPKRRNATNTDLFNAAMNLFSGKALIWFRSVRSKLNDWDAVVCLFKEEFLTPDFDDLLWDEIKGLLQGQNESKTT
jgi:hypothetical protein